jgi:hypothetical protein
MLSGPEMTIRRRELTRSIDGAQVYRGNHVLSMGNRASDGG